MEQKNYAVGEQRERDAKGWSASEANCGKRVLPVGLLSLSSCLRKTLMKKAVRKKNNKGIFKTTLFDPALNVKRSTK